MTEMMMTGKAKIAGVMGWPVEHSKSPRLHGYWLRQFGIDGTYIPMPVKPEDLERALRALPALGFKGTNLTIPHKEKAMAIVDQIDPIAQRIGAINTVIVQEDGSLYGTNTDAFGFAENLNQAGFSKTVKKECAVVLGAGGASRAIIAALQDFGFKEIRIVNRNEDRAHELAASMSGQNQFSVFPWDRVAAALEGANLLVNTTSLGMVGQPALEIDLAPLGKEAWVTDAVYAPLETDLLKQARAMGFQVVDGIGMLLHQARPGFEAWFGAKPSVDDGLRAFVLSAP